MAFPPTHFLVGCGVAEVVRSVTPLPRWKAWLLAGCLAVSPDLDFVVGLIAGRASAYHGTFTHSLFAVAVVGVLAWLVAGKEWGLVSGAGYGSHLLVDLLDDRGRTNVLLGWPFTLEQPFAIARIFPIVPFEQGNGIWIAALSLLDPPVFRQLAIQTLLGAVSLLLLVVLAAVVRRGRALASRQIPLSPEDSRARRFPR